MYRSTQKLLTNAVIASTLLAIPSFSMASNIVANGNYLTSTLKDDLTIDNLPISPTVNNPVITLDEPNKSLFLTSQVVNPSEIIMKAPAVAKPAVIATTGTLANISVGTFGKIKALDSHAIEITPAVANFGTITNLGSLETQNGGVNTSVILVDASNFVLIENKASGTITGGAGAGSAITIQNGVSITGNIINAGNITTGAIADVIAIKKTLVGSITNSGTIQSNIANTDVIQADEAISGGIINTGNILQTNAVGFSAIYSKGALTVSNDTVTGIIKNTGNVPAINSTSDLSVNNTNGALIESTNSAAITVINAATNQSGSIINTGAIIKGATFGVNLSVLSTYTGKIENSGGTIQATGAAATGIKIDAGLSGGIINANNTTDPNNIIRGIIKSDQGDGILLIKDRTNITNAGDIFGNHTALGGSAAIRLDPNAKSDITNTTTGVIKSFFGDTHGILYTSKTDSVVLNSGTIEGAGIGDGIHLSGGKITGSITNSTKTGKILSLNAKGIDATGGISGGIINEVDAQIVSTGDIGILVNIDRTNITNAGTISGGSNTGGGIRVVADSDITNAATGTIKGATGTSYGILYDNSPVFNTNSVLVNNGTIQSNNAASAIDIRTKITGSLTNFGNIKTETIDAGKGITVSTAQIAAGFTGGLVNKSTGIISGPTAIEITATDANNKMNITNELGGIIQSEIAAGGGFAINVNTVAGTQGGITNFGAIQTTTKGTAIRVGTGAMVGQILNKSTGVISTFDDITSIAIDAVGDIGAGFINGSIINEGTINAGVLGGYAVKMGPNTVNRLINTGSITGRVLLGKTTSRFDLNAGSSFSGSIDGIGGVGNATVNSNPGTGKSFTLGNAVDAFAIRNVGVLNVNNGTLILNKDATALNEINVLNNANIELNGNVSTVGGKQLFTVNDNATVKVTKNIVMNTDYTFVQDPLIAGTGQHIITIKDNTVGNFGAMDMSNRNFTAPNSTRIKILLGDGYIADGDQFPIFTNVNKITDSSQLSGPDSAVILFKKQTIGKNIVLTAKRNSLPTLVTPDALDLAKVLEEIGQDPSLKATYAQVLGQISTLNSKDDVRQAVQMIGDDISGAKRIPAHEAHLQQLKLLSDRLSLVRAERDLRELGYSAGNWSDYNTGVWGQVLGSYSKQEERNSIAGYETDLHGFLFGADALMMDYLTMGAALGYSYTRVSINNLGKNSIKLRGLQATVYGTYEMPNSYVEGLFSIGGDRYRTLRNIVIGTLRQEARADYDGAQYAIKFGAGWPLMRGQWQFTPLLLTEMTRVVHGDYTERGAGSLSLRVDPQGNTVWNVGGGLRAAIPYETNFGTFNMEGTSVVKHDVLGTRQKSVAEFVGGGPKFLAYGARPVKTGLYLGAGATLVAKNNYSYIFNYELELRSQYYHNTAYFTLRYAL